MANRNELIIERLCKLADSEYFGVKKWVGQLEPPHHIVLLIQITRALDYWHVVQTFSKKPEHKLLGPDFDIMVRGWNPALALLLPYAGGLRGVPFTGSTSDSQEATMTILHQLGRFAMLKESAEMIRSGMAEGEIKEGVIRIRMSDRISDDHFLDRLEGEKLKDLKSRIDGFNPLESLIDEHRVDDLQARIEQLVHPRNTGSGTMVGYDGAPDIDVYFLAVVTKSTMDWRNETGIHPTANIGGVPGSTLAAMGSLLVSSYLKHIYFVDIGTRKMPEANLAMSLTIWKTRDDLRDSICDFTGMAKPEVSAALDLFTVKPDQHAYFEREPTPFIPMLVEISDGYLLSPVSSIFRNPFNGIRMLQEWRSNQAAISVRVPRENWMISDLCHLFLGNRYAIVDQPTRLKRTGITVTDIDTAIFDRTTGELALFQLKWQDFSTSEIKKQRSKARNFVDDVDAWAEKVEMWIEVFGFGALCRSLQLKISPCPRVSAVRLFAIGRLASRFKSYGYAPKSANVAISMWAQFVRIRYEVGPVENVFTSLHKKIQGEVGQPVDRKPQPHQIIAGEQKIVFEDLWNVY